MWLTPSTLLCQLEVTAYIKGSTNTYIHYITHTTQLWSIGSQYACHSIQWDQNWLVMHEDMNRCWRHEPTHTDCTDRLSLLIDVFVMRKWQRNRSSKMLLIPTVPSLLCTYVCTSSTSVPVCVYSPSLEVCAPSVMIQCTQKGLAVYVAHKCIQLHVNVFIHSPTTDLPFRLWRTIVN